MYPVSKTLRCVWEVSPPDIFCGVAACGATTSILFFSIRVDDDDLFCFEIGCTELAQAALPLEQRFLMRDGVLEKMRGWHLPVRFVGLESFPVTGSPAGFAVGEYAGTPVPPEYA